jgi:hypothetical protein
MVASVASGDDCILYAGMMIVNVDDVAAGYRSKNCSNSFNQRAVTPGETFMPFHFEHHEDFGKTEQVVGRTEVGTTSIC